MANRAVARNAANRGLVRPLFDGPLDVIGDVHGEREALESLIAKLGYDRSGKHRGGRRLVFVGDLCDRGPDSPGLIRFVQYLVEEGRAQVVIGNHELNILRREEKHGNHWFFGRSFEPEFGPCAAIEEAEQDAILAFFRSLPLALERSGLRIVHAAWDDAAVNACRGLSIPIDEAYRRFDVALRATQRFQELEARYREELRRLGPALKERSTTPVAAAIGPYDELFQVGNPVRVLTSGLERATDTPFFCAGKWRFVTRVPWWHEYAGEIPVLFGHYWRYWDPSMHKRLSKGEPHLFADDEVGPSMAVHHRAFCIDFSVGSRYKQRARNHGPPFHGRLAAMRWPERELVFDAEEPVTTGWVE